VENSNVQSVEVDATSARLVCTLPENWIITLPGSFDQLYADIAGNARAIDPEIVTSLEGVRDQFLDAAALAKSENVLFGAVGMYEVEGRKIAAEVIVSAPPNSPSRVNEILRQMNGDWAQVWAERPYVVSKITKGEHFEKIDYIIEDIFEELVFVIVTLGERSEGEMFLDFANSIVGSIRIGVSEHS
jgi:hypothetical protein